MIRLTDLHRNIHLLGASNNFLPEGNLLLNRIGKLISMKSCYENQKIIKNSQRKFDPEQRFLIRSMSS